MNNEKADVHQFGDFTVRVLTLLVCAAQLLQACGPVSQALHFFHTNTIPLSSFPPRYYILRCNAVEFAAEARMTKMNKSYHSLAMHVRVLQLSSLFHYRIYMFNSNIFILVFKHGREKCWETSNTNSPQYFQQTIFNHNFITYTGKMFFYCKPEKQWSFTEFHNCIVQLTSRSYWYLWQVQVYLWSDLNVYIKC